jgi:hypothetical protein
LFQAPAGCTLIDGTVSATRWCKLLSKKAASGG